MTILLVAHGTRNPHGVNLIGDLATAVSRRMYDTVRVAFVDVLGPSPSEVLADLSHERVVVVPAFLSHGYHVRVDIPEHITASGHADCVVTPALGPSPALAAVLMDRLHEAGYGGSSARASGLVLAAAGSSDPHAQHDIQTMARMLSTLSDSPVQVGYAAPPATGEHPSVADAVDHMRRTGAEQVAVASFLLAPGLFQNRLRESQAEIVAQPLGVHPQIVELVCARVSRARADIRV